MLAWIQDLYAIDARATDLSERKRLRSTESRAVTEDEGLDAGRDGAEDDEPGRRHSLHARHWSRLTLFLDDAEIWLDNNRTERGLSGPVIGRGITSGPNPRAAPSSLRPCTASSSQPRPRAWIPSPTWSRSRRAQSGIRAPSSYPLTFRPRRNASLHEIRISGGRTGYGEAIPPATPFVAAAPAPA